MAIYLFQKIVKKNDQLQADFKHGEAQYFFPECELESILRRYDNGDFSSNQAVVRSEFVKGLRQLLIAKDGGLQSLLDPGRVM